jgi:1-acyl-sn-glycerol-3-phosphate acyltransferase
MTKKVKASDIYSNRDEKYFNFPRTMFQRFVTRVWYYYTFHIANRLKVIGKENLPKNNEFIAVANHLSTLDPVLVANLMPYPISYMAKKELFEHPLVRLMLDWLGAFAVDREKLGVSTIKTALRVKKMGWLLGLFPQGTREKPGKITKITRGFVGLAKSTKCGLLPVGITGTENKSKKPFSGRVVVKIGKLIPYSENTDEMYNAWINAIQELTGYQYCPEE